MEAVIWADADVNQGVVNGPEDIALELCGLRPSKGQRNNGHMQTPYRNLFSHNRSALQAAKGQGLGQRKV